MKKWYDEEYEFEIEVTGFLRGNETEGYCRNGEQVGDKYTCTYGCPVNAQGQGICSKTMTALFPVMDWLLTLLPWTRSDQLERMWQIAPLFWK